MAFEATRKTVYDLLNDISYNIPINQRKYVWKKNNWEELFDDINLNDFDYDNKVVPKFYEKIDI